MITVLVPFAVIILIMVVRKIPKIGGDARWALAIGALTALLMGGIFNPLKWFMACFTGLDNVAFVLFLILFGGLFSEVQVQDGAMETFLNFLRSAFGKSPKRLLVVMIIFLVFAGALFGDATAAVTIVGFLGLAALIELQLSPEQITAALVMGSAMGSIMPPISQAIVLAGSLVGLTDLTPAINYTYLTVGLGAVIMCFYASRWVRIKKLPDELIPKESARDILSKGWKALVPLAILFVIVLIQSAGFDLLGWAHTFLDPTIGQVPILKGFTNKIVVAIAFCFILSFFYKPARDKTGTIFKNGLKKIANPMLVMVCAAFLVGAFRAGGQVTIVQQFAEGLNPNVLILGGAFAMVLTGMITGLQSATQTTIFSILGPTLVNSVGVPAVFATVAGAHLAMAGQGLPPADMLTFLTAGIVGGIMGKEVNPLKSMMYSMPQCVYFVLVGIVFLYLR